MQVPEVRLGRRVRGTIAIGMQHPTTVCMKDGVSMANLMTLTLLLICLAASCAVGQTPTIEQLRDLSLETSFAEAGTSQCIIAVPDQDGYSSMADHLATAVATVSGAKPAVMAASGITDEMAQANHVIALGVFANNSLVEKLYDRLLVSCDWSWPEGDDSYVIRTVHNPWQTGRNVVYLGSVTAAGCEAAVNRFVGILTENPGGTIGPIIEVSSAPAALTDDEVQEHLGRIDAETSSRTMDGHVAQFAENYFRTGDPAWARIFLDGVRKMIALHVEEGDASDMRNCRYIFPQFERIEYGPDFSDHERLELVNLFLRLADMMPLSKQELKPSPIPHGNSWNGHAAGYAGIYLTRYYPDIAIGQRLLQNIDTYNAPNMVYWKVNEDCPGYGNITLTGNYEWALARPVQSYFDGGSLGKMCDWYMLISDNSGRASGIGDDSGLGGPISVNAYMLAGWKYRDGRYLWWWDRHINGKGRYWVPEEIIPRVQPDNMLGVATVPVDEWIYNQHQPHKFPIEKGYDKVSFRSGFEKSDQYLCMSGYSHGFHAHADANAIVRYADREQVRLYDDGYMIPALSEHNTVTILKNGWAATTPELSEVMAEANFDDVGMFTSRLDDYNGICWDRTIIWPKGRFFLVVDDLTALEPARYGFQCIWRTLGSASLNGRRWTSEKEGSRMNLVCASDAVLAEKESAGLTLNSPPFPMSEARALVQAAAPDMAAGDGHQFANVLYTTDVGDGSTQVDCYRVDDSTTYIISDNGQPIAAGINRSTAVSGVLVEGDAFYLTPTELAVAGARRVRIDGRLVRSNLPVNLNVDLNTGKAILECAEQVEVRHSTAGGNATVTLQAGRHELQLPPASLTRMPTLEQRLSSLFRDCALAAAAAASEQAAVGTGEKLAELWQYRNFAVYTNFALQPDVTCAADQVPLTPEEADYPVGKLQDLLRPNGNVMFPEGQTVTLDIALPQPADIAQVAVNSRQLPTFRGGPGCGVSKFTVWVSNDGFSKDRRLLGEFINSSDKLEGDMVPYVVEDRQTVTARQVRIELVPFSEGHKVYIDSVELNGTAGADMLMASGFHVSAIQTADVNDDGRDEIFAAGTDRAIHAVAADGSGLWQYPVPNAVNDLAVFDGTGHGDYQIVAACEDTYMYSVKPDGTENFTVQPPPRTYERPGYRGVLPFVSRLTVAFGADINGDGNTEIIIGSANWRTYVYNYLGELLWDEVCWAHTPTCGDAFDLTGDGAKEVVMGNSYDRAVVYSSDGNVIGSGGGSVHAGPTALRCADLDGNGKGEIVVGDRAGMIWFQEWNGRDLPIHDTGMDITALEVGDLDGDGKLETVAASKNFILYFFDSDGQPLRQVNLLTVARDLAIADLTGDGVPEIVAACEDGTVKVLDVEGQVIAWFKGGGWMRHVDVVELDGNPATREIVATCDDGSIYALQFIP